MSNRSHKFAPTEHYHCFNRGVDKRNIFLDQKDYSYFLKSLKAYNTHEVAGNLKSLENKQQIEPPVTILAYSLLPNHYHLLLRCNVDNGVSKYLQRVAGGYTMYFNQKYRRSGALFQGTFKSTYVESDQDLRQLLAYVKHNNQVHSLHDTTLYRSNINTKDELIRGLTSDFDDMQQQEVVEIIKDLRAEAEFDKKHKSEVRPRT